MAGRSRALATGCRGDSTAPTVVLLPGGRRHADGPRRRLPRAACSALTGVVISPEEPADAVVAECGRIGFRSLRILRCLRQWNGGRAGRHLTWLAGMRQPRLDAPAQGEGS
jgi:hypothetical protein